MVSRITVLMIQSNDVEIIETAERIEAWTMKGGHFHALMLSCPHDKRSELETFIAEVKNDSNPIY